MGTTYRIQTGIGAGLSDNEAAKNERVQLYWEGQPLTSFKDQDQMLHVMREINPKTGKSYYSESAAYRKTVEALIANSVGVEGVNYDPTEKRAENFIRGLEDDALRQTYNEVVAKAGGKDARAKLEAVRWLQDPANAETIARMEQVTGLGGTNRPLEQELKNAGPMRWQMSTDDASDIPQNTGAPVSPDLVTEL